MICFVGHFDGQSSVSGPWKCIFPALNYEKSMVANKGAMAEKLTFRKTKRELFTILSKKFPPTENSVSVF